MQKILILDFGSQYTQLITRVIRDLEVYSEIHPFNYPIEKIREDESIKAIILSGGPSSVYAENAPNCSMEILNLGIPVLGICYGLQLIAHNLGGIVQKAEKREYGKAKLEIKKIDKLFSDFDSENIIWMSHGDTVISIPEDYETLAVTENTDYCAIKHKSKDIYGLQFHPEVTHSLNGKQLIKNFLYKISGVDGDWSSSSFIENSVNEIKNIVGDEKVLCAISGGVDSTVVASLIHKAIKDNLTCVFVNTGLLRNNEVFEVEKTLRDNLKINLIVKDEASLFLEKLKGVSDPEQKRKIIGETFIEVFDRESKKLGNFRFLAQGTLYPDVIESISDNGPSVTIKSHHNVGGLPEKINFELLEPFRKLFKDEVRKIGLSLGLPEHVIMRHPFPGPGLAIRILGDVTEERVELLQKADKIFVEGLEEYNLYNQIWQAFAVLLPVRTVGVMGDERTYDNVLALRAVTSNDGMTAEYFHFPYDFLTYISSKITNEVKGINRVVYDISSKPPATIEWE